MFQGIEDIERFQREIVEKMRDNEYGEYMMIRTDDAASVYFLLEKVKDIMKITKEIEGGKL